MCVSVPKRCRKFWAPGAFWGGCKGHRKTAQQQNERLSPKQIPLPLWILEKSQ